MNPYRWIAVAGVVIASGCSGGGTRSEPEAVEPPRTGPTTVDSPAPATTTTPTPTATDPIPAPIPETPRRSIGLIEDPATLAVLERTGASFDRLVPPARWDAIATTLEADLARIARADSKAGVGIRGHAHRLFDAKWLRSSQARLELVAATYRIDRTPLTPGRCGDVRLVYRLAYTTETSGEQVSSRLPMTVAVVLRGPQAADGDCAAAARRWRVPDDLAGDALGAHLTAIGGPLDGLAPGDVDQVLTNLQLVRWPSAVRPDLGGHAEYGLRAFVPDGDALAPAPLDNVPDVDRIRRDKSLRAELVAWVRDPETLTRIDDGTARLPAHLAARIAVSVAPRGLARRANRPYRQLIAPDELADLPLDGRRWIASPEALLRRLDEQTCMGCHQARTIAGFHALGVDGPDTAAGNALAVSSSPHLQFEGRRRAGLIDAVARGEQVSFARPPAERSPDDTGGSGDRCALGDPPDPGFAAWTCADGYVCDRYDAPDDDVAVGTCVAAGAGEVGEPCEIVPLKAHADPHRDRAPRPRLRACRDGAVCNTNRVGFPGGMCTSGCADLPPEAACGAIALLGPFNSCLARREPFPRCLAEHVAPAGLRACDADHPCRDDYICTRTSAGAGACIPPYFLFQLRVDGHPL